MRRVGRPTLGDEPRKLIALRRSAETKGVALLVFDQRDPGGGDEETGLISQCSG